MKSIIEEYGKIVITALVVFAMLSVIVLFLNGDVTRKLTPKSTVGQENVSEKLIAYGRIKEPVLVIKPERLKSGVSYDLLSFVSEAHSNPDSRDAEGHYLYMHEEEKRLDLLENVEIIKITDPEGQEISVPAKASGKVMVPFDRYEWDTTKEDLQDYTASYRVTYSLADDYYSDHPITTEKTCQFVVD